MPMDKREFIRFLMSHPVDLYKYITEKYEDEIKNKRVNPLFVKIPEDKENDNK